MDDVAVLIAKQAITEQLYAYGRGCDLIDVELIASVFHEDSVADYGAMFQGTGRGFAEFIGQVHPAMLVTMHTFTNLTIRVDGEQAASETYSTMHARVRDGEGALQTLDTYGRYLDRWERREGGWRITHRTYLHFLDEVRPAGVAMFETTGSRDGNDPSYAVLG